MNGNYLYAGIGIRLVAFNIQTSIEPKETGSTAPMNGSVTGIAISGNLAAVSAGGGGLYLVDISTPSHPEIVGHYGSKGYANGVAFSGAYVYVADGPDGLIIVNIANPSDPTEVANVFNLDYAFDVAISGTTAYVAAGGSGIKIANIANPSNPSSLGSLDTSGYDFAVAVNGGTAFVAAGWNGLQSLDVSSPATPRVIENVTTTGWAMGVSVEDGLVYVAEGESGLQVYQSQGGTLSRLGGFQVSDSNFVAVAVDASTAFLADETHGLYIVDVSNPSQPSELSLFPSLFNVQSVVLSGDYAYAGSTNGVVRVVNITNPADLLDTGEFTLPGPAGAMASSQGSLYVGVQGLQLLFPFNVTDPTNPDPRYPTSLSFYTPGGQFGGVTGGSPRGAVLQGDTLYISDESGLVIYDVANPSAPCMLGHLLASPNMVDGNPVNFWFTLDAYDGLAAMTEYNGSSSSSPAIVIVNITNPRQPTVIGQYNSGLMDGESSQSVAFYSGILYFMSNSQLYALNVRDLANPTEISSIPLPNSADNTFNAVRLMTSYQGKLLLLDGTSLVAVDVSNPAKMTISGSLSLPFLPSWVGASGGYIYVADGQGGVYVAQMSNTSQPASTSSIGQTGPAFPYSNSFGVHTNLPEAGSSLAHEVVLLTIEAGQAFAGAIHLMVAQVTDLLDHSSAVTGHPTGEGEGAAAAPADPPNCTVTNTADSGTGSLRECLLSESQGGTIAFSRVVFLPESPATIFLTSALNVQSNIVINGTGAGVIINGSKMAYANNGIGLEGNHIILQGLEIVDFPSNGVGVGGSYDTVMNCVVSGNKDTGVDVGSGPGNVVVGSYIGTNPGGTEVLGSQNAGVALDGEGNTIGGASRADRNIIAGNLVYDVVGDSTYGNTIEGNYIGLDASGNRILDPPSTFGVSLQVNSSGNFVIGNVITTQRIALVTIDPGSQYDSVEGNLIGLDAAGNTGLAQNIVIIAAPYDIIGGTLPADRNVIYGFIQVTVPDVFVLGNYFGTDISGTSALPGLAKSIYLPGTTFDFIGGTGANDGNVMDTPNGIQITSGSSYDFVLGNRIGTNPTGQVVTSDNYDVEIQGSQHLFLQGNLVSGGSQAGFYLSTNSDYNTIRANMITDNQGVGTNVTGTGNLIYGNSFINNGVNAHDYGQGNLWDNGVSGNYWSDYTGVNGGSGIGTTPYIVTPNGVDRYPLTSPPSLPTA
ncbi:MAG: hypothetical protein JRM99_05830 [Nitrososphaerota archaeon]|nr:hypothetical protein [Nitrososphaerota archaeon]